MGEFGWRPINVDILAIGGDGSNGNVQIENANEKVLVKTKHLMFNQKSQPRFSQRKQLMLSETQSVIFMVEFLIVVDGSTKVIGSKHHQQMKNKTEARTT